MIRLVSRIVIATGSSSRCRFDALCRSRRVRLAGLALALLIMNGCGRTPQIAKRNVNLVEKLRTAVAAKNSGWLESTTKQVEEQHHTGKLSPEEYAVLESIVTEAKQGHWDEANAQMLRLVNGQRPQ